jgi:sigma-E factor negative regulatory protein RseA
MKDERPQDQSGDRQGERDSQVSAMFDSELPVAECELLARRLVRDEALRSQWSRYALIGAALRAERGVALHDRVAWRVQSVVAQESSYGDSATVDTAAVTAARPAGVRQSPGVTSADRWSRFARPVFGAGIAAGVAALSILWLRTQDNTDAALVASNRVPASAATQIIAAPTAAANTLALNQKPASVRESASGTGERGAYTTPAPSSRNSIAPPAQLANYVVAHSEYSGPLSRRLALLSVVGTEGAVEMPPADVSTAPKSGAATDAH